MVVAGCESNLSPFKSIVASRLRHRNRGNDLIKRFSSLRAYQPHKHTYQELRWINYLHIGSKKLRKTKRCFRKNIWSRFKRFSSFLTNFKSPLQNRNGKCLSTTVQMVETSFVWKRNGHNPQFCLNMYRSFPLVLNILSIFLTKMHGRRDYGIQIIN